VPDINNFRRLYYYCCKLSVMGDRRQTGKQSRYVTSNPGQLGLAIPPRVGAVSLSERRDVNRHTARCTISQCKLVSGYGNGDQRRPRCALWLGKEFTLRYVTLHVDACWQTAWSDGDRRAAERNHETDSTIQGIPMCRHHRRLVIYRTM